MAGTSPAMTSSTSLENALASSSPTTDATASRARGAISIRNVTKVYDPDGVNVLAVENCSVEIAPGEFCVVVGPSGCGKTTLLNAIAGFHDITAGEILLDGRDLHGRRIPPNPEPTASSCFRTEPCFPGARSSTMSPMGPSCRERPRAREARRQAAGLLAELGLAEIGGRYPNELSSGMRRRAEIARALINDPKVLLLDEPFRAMDALTKGVAQEFLLQAYDRVRKTIFFITHDLEEALFLADRVLVMTTRPGRIKQVLNVDFERPAELPGARIQALSRAQGRGVRGRARGSDQGVRGGRTGAGLMLRSDLPIAPCRS